MVNLGFLPVGAGGRSEAESYYRQAVDAGYLRP